LLKMQQHSKNISDKLRDMPRKPGVYQFFDENEKLLYVGKAKSLRNRVRSYFTDSKIVSGKTRMLVRKTTDIKCILVKSEFDALLLENELIKKHQPRYNIQWRDDKSYPWICIKNERFPRVFSTRTLVNDGSLYFGPYASVKLMKSFLDLASKLYPLRNCNYHLSEENIKKQKFRLCLEYQIGNCKGPCEGLQGEADYNQSIEAIKAIIKGNTSSVMRQLKALMKKHSENLEFEKAQFLKEKLEVLEKYQSRSTVVNPSISNVDVFSIVADEGSGFVNYMKVVKGAVIQSHTIELKKKLEESPEELLAMAIAELRQRFESNSKEIYTSFHLDLKIPNVKIHVPQKGEKRKLLELSAHNARHFMKEIRAAALASLKKDTPTRILKQLQEDLRLKELPAHIECFDNSNIQGTTPVAACVVFKNAKPAKKDYRHFNIKTVEGPDDFASMEEVVFRRYYRQKKEAQRLPQLIVIDGGKGQLSSAVKALEKLELKGKIPVIGIAKKLEEIYFPNDPVPLYIDKKSESLKLIQQLRNEAHRFGIAHHRKKRVKTSVKSELAEIQGIGQNTIRQLLRKFKSVKRVKNASQKELEEIINKKRAEIVWKHFH